MGSIEYAEHLPAVPKTFPLGVGLGDMAHQNVPARVVLFKFHGNMGAPGPIVQDGDQNPKGIVKEEIPDFLHIVVLVIGWGVHEWSNGLNVWLIYQK